MLFFFLNKNKIAVYTTCWVGCDLPFEVSLRHNFHEVDFKK